MNNKIVFIRHAKTKIDKKIPIAGWDLAEEGYEQSEQVKDIEELQDVDIIISSTEQKASLTVKPLADKLEKEVIQIKELGEVKRPNSEKLSSEEYDEMKFKFFADLDFSENDWESATSALERYSKVIKEINEIYENKK